jgi:uncharacterized protein with PQ loop repeat
MNDVFFSFGPFVLTYELLGWIGSILFAFCGLPQAIHAFKHKHADGMTWTFILMWLFGEIFTLLYISSKENILPLLSNYILNIIFLLVILYFKIFPKNK